MTLEGKALSFRYQSGARQILNAIDIRLESSESVGLFAPSGFGKTTLCRILAGYETPDEGAVLLEGKPLNSFKGYCPVQLIGQHPELAVNPRLRLKETLKEAGITDERFFKDLGIDRTWLNRFPGELSGGELQRFCIARALNEKTRFILADEITTMLDLVTQAQIWQFLFAQVQTRGIGLMVVSHHKALMDRLCTRTIDLVMQSGA